jgi:hypothetical protein
MAAALSRLRNFDGGVAAVPLASKKREPDMARINYVELPSRNFAASKDFYKKAFNWSLTDFGPTYAATMTGDVDMGLQGDMPEATATPLVVIDVDNLEDALAAVQKAGATITKPIFQFPGGRRFHFKDPSGNELSCVKGD